MSRPETHITGQVLPDPTRVHILPTTGMGYKLTGQTDAGIELAIGYNFTLLVDVATLVQLGRELPLTRELFAADPAANTVRLPSPYAFNTFSTKHLQPLGASRMVVKQIESRPGHGFTSPDLVGRGGFADGIILLPTDAEYYFHDTTDHMLGALTLENRQTEIFQQMANVFCELQETDPKTARYLSDILADAFDSVTPAQLRFRKNSGEYGDGPRLLLAVLMKLQSKLSRERGANADRLKRVQAAIEETIEAPEGYKQGIASVILGKRRSKLKAWAQWEKKHMPAYAARIRQKLSEAPVWPPQGTVATLGTLATGEQL